MSNRLNPSGGIERLKRVPAIAALFFFHCFPCHAEPAGNPVPPHLIRSTHTHILKNPLPHVHHLADGSHALRAAADGRIQRVHLERCQVVAETSLKSAIQTTALSAPRAARNQLLAVATLNPPTLTILDETLRVLKVIPVKDKTGRIAASLSTIRTAPARNSFIGLLTDVPELWEVSYHPAAAEIGLGLIHDFRYSEGEFLPGYLNPQRSALHGVATDFVLLPSGHDVLTVHPSDGGPLGETHAKLYVMHLDVRKPLTKSPPRFLPNNVDANWRQVDPQTLPEETNGPAIPVVKSTLRFVTPQQESTPCWN